jgi:hypothetical protein
MFSAEGDTSVFALTDKGEMIIAALDALNAGETTKNLK